VFNKVDLLPAEEREEICRKFLRNLRWKGKSFAVSAITGEGCKELTYAIMDYLDQGPEKTAED